MSSMLSILLLNGQRVHVEDKLNLMVCFCVNLPMREGVLWVTVASMRGLQRKLVEIVEGIPGIWKCMVCGAHKCWSAQGIYSHAAGMLSPDGRCKTLDAAADGYVRAEACGALVLSATTKEEASAPGHKYMALIASSSVNQVRNIALTRWILPNNTMILLAPSKRVTLTNVLDEALKQEPFEQPLQARDGRSSALTAPNGPAQQAVMRAALASGNMHAQSITGLQLHGTGTPLGDPIEVGAAAAVLTPSTSQASASLPVLISAAKSVVGCTQKQALPYDLCDSIALFVNADVGHTEAAAGVVGLCHTVFGLGSSLAQPLAHLHGVGSHLATALPSGSHAVMGLPRQQAGAAGHAAVKVSGRGSTPKAPCLLAPLLFDAVHDPPKLFRPPAC
eukprot:1136161-Pelagomonas_calceolata.AAC.4